MYDPKQANHLSDEKKVQTMHEAQQTIELYSIWKDDVQRGNCPIIFKTDERYNGPKLMGEDHRKMAIMMMTVEIDAIIDNAKEMRRAIAETFI